MAWAVGVTAPPRAEPHSPQNSNSGSFELPQDGQTLASVAPHRPQNFRPAGFSVPHFEQTNRHPLGAAARTNGTADTGCCTQEGRLRDFPSTFPGLSEPDPVVGARDDPADDGQSPNA
jgi:hypothetical protein